MTSDNTVHSVQSAAMLYETAASWMPGKSVAELSTEELLRRPAENRSHSYWILGHMVAGADISPFLDGSDSVVDDQYLTLFDIDTKPKDDASEYPPFIELLSLYQKAVDHTVETLKGMDDSDLVKPPATLLPEPLREYFSNRMEIVAGFATHLSYHAGQIGTMLKLLGK